MDGHDGEKASRTDDFLLLVVVKSPLLKIAAESVIEASVPPTRQPTGVRVVSPKLASILRAESLKQPCKFAESQVHVWAGLITHERLVCQKTVKDRGCSRRYALAG